MTIVHRGRLSSTKTLLCGRMSIRSIGPLSATSTPGRVKRRSSTRGSTAHLPPKKQIKREIDDEPDLPCTPGPQSKSQARILSLCDDFADWLDELHECKNDQRIRDAVERDGEAFFRLIRRTLDYEDALNGSVRDGGHSPHFCRRIQALRDFASFLESTPAVSLPLWRAIERDGKQLFRLARCCLKFDSVINGQ